ncbi:MAG: carbohydrate porin, partial [Gemmatimonadota bacterium]|nr:carbohydrate porin [Gemmatimonadota bacterium]
LALAASPLMAHPDDSGLTFNAAYTGDLLSNVSGGLRTGGTYLDNLDLQIAAERGSIFGIPGLSGLLYGLYNNANEFSEKYVGDAQIVSNIEGPRAWRLYEAWLDWAYGDAEAFSARLGLYDLNSEFDVTDTAGLFLNGAHGVGTDLGQSGENGPSIFPVTSLTLRLRAQAENGAYGMFAVLDGVPGDPNDDSSNEIDLSSDDGALLVLEGGWSGDNWRKLAIGLWQYTADFDRLAATTPLGDPVRDDGNNGWYAIADRTLWSGDRGTAAGFLRIGQADDRFNAFDGYLGAGASLSGFWPRRPDDTVGLAMAMAFTGSEYEEAQALAGLGTDDHETSIELTWRAPVTDWLTLQPDVQYIINPGTNPDLDDAVVIGLRFELSWSSASGGG